MDYEKDNEVVNNPDKGGLADVAKPQSEVFSCIDRIDNKIESLRSVLAPVIAPIPSNLKDSGGGTELMTSLQRLESKLTEILDSVQL